MAPTAKAGKNKRLAAAAMAAALAGWTDVDEWGGWAADLVTMMGVLPMMPLLVKKMFRALLGRPLPRIGMRGGPGRVAPRHLSRQVPSQRLAQVRPSAF
jgi:hypothetical protein